MSGRTIADEAGELYDLATVLTVDVASQLVANGLGDLRLVCAAERVRASARVLANMLGESKVGEFELPARTVDTKGCGFIVDGILARARTLDSEERGQRKGVRYGTTTA